MELFQMYLTGVKSEKCFMIHRSKMLECLIQLWLEHQIAMVDGWIPCTYLLTCKLQVGIF